MGRHSSPYRDPTGPYPLQTVLTVGVCVLIGYTVWAWNGLGGWVEPTRLGLGCLLMVFTAFAARIRGSSGLLRDPYTWLGLTFMLFLAIQTWNSGRYLYFNPVAERWMHTATPFPSWPGSFNRSESMQMLYWFLPAWALGLAVRHAPDSRTLARRALLFFVANGTVLALFGLIQHVTGSDVAYRFSEAGRGPFYASFGYRNHAVAYLLLVLAVALGYLAYRLRQRWFMAETRVALDVWLAATASLLVFIAIHPALSRAGIMLAWLLVLLFWAPILSRHLSLHSPSARLQVGIVIILGMGIALFWIAVFGGDALLRRMGGAPLETFRTNIETRAWMWSAALHMWEDHKLWGVGGWGYRHLLPLYAEGAGLLEVHLPGKANTHNDALQFLAEFGIAGFGLLLGATAVLVARFVRNGRHAWGRPARMLFAITFGGLFFVGLHSLFDLPFRNAAVLQACVLLLTAVPAACPNTQGPGVRKRHKAES